MFVGSYVKCLQISITTNPFLPQNIVARSYDNFQIIATITGSPDDCYWSTHPPNAFFYKNNICMSRDVPEDEYSTFCTKVDDNITLTYTFQSPMVSDVNFGIYCNLHEDEFRQTILVRIQGKY